MVARVGNINKQKKKMRKKAKIKKERRHIKL
jgi:hypothetical protein